MRVLQLIDSLEAGGAERMAVNLANALHEANIPVVLVASRASGLLQSQIHSQVPFFCLHKQSTFDFKAFKQLKTIVIDHQIEVIHAHSSSFFMATWLKWRLPHLIIVWHDHYGQSEMLSERPHRMLKFCARYFDGIIAVNQQLAVWSRTVLKHQRIKVLPNFVVMTPMEQPTTILNGVAGKRLVCLANLRPQKDHLTLLKAFKQVNITHPDWTLHLVGKDFKDDYSNQVKAAVIQLALESKVFIYGSCEDVANILLQAKMGVLSSQSEGLPLALLEYGMAGLPVVTTSVGDVSQVIAHQKNGLLVPPNSAKALADGIMLSINKPERAQEFAMALQTTVQQLYSADAAVAQLLKFYKSLGLAT